MKYMMIIPDGMPDKAFGYAHIQTPLQLAATEQMDSLAAEGQTGLAILCKGCQNPENGYSLLSVFGADPERVFRGSAAMSFIGEGNTLDKEDVCLYCSFVTEYEQEENHYLREMSGELSPEEIKELFQYLKENLENDVFEFCTGKGTNQYIVWKKGEVKPGAMYAPSLFEKMSLDELMPKGDFTLPLMTIMQRSVELLKGHPVNTERAEQGKTLVTGLWIWGASMLPSADSFERLYGMKPTIITDSYIACGAGECMQADVNLDREGFASMAEKAKKALSEKDFVILVTEQPMLFSLAGDAENKQASIENLDKEIVGTLRKYLEDSGEDYAMVIVPSVTVSAKDRAFTADFVPYLFYRSDGKCEGTKEGFCEKTAFAAGNFVTSGKMLIESMIK